MKQFEMYELSFTGPVPTASEALVDIRGEFTHEGKTTAVKGFYAGDGNYKVRFLPEQAGRYTWRVSGAVSGEGALDMLPADVIHHGVVRAEGTHLRHADGTLCRPFGTTVYALMHQTRSLMDETMETLRNAPFNKIRLCLFPKDFVYNQNEPDLYPFERNSEGCWDIHRPCYSFWDAFERRLEQLFDMGYQVDLILFHPYDRWGFSKLSHEDDLVYLGYLLRRFAAYPNLWWSMANEYDLCAAKTLEDWHGIEEFIAENDPYHHLIGCHHCITSYDHSRKNITHVSLQTGQLCRVGDWQRVYDKPVLIDECGYEGNLPEPWGSLSGREMTARFWRACALGGYCTHGETFLDDQDEIVYWAKGGKLRGESPARIAFLREIMESLPGPLEQVAEGFCAFRGTTAEELQKLLAETPKEQRIFAERILGLEPAERERFLDTQVIYAGRCGDEAFLTYYDLRCSARSELRLPETGSYTVEVLDTWEMTRTVLESDAKGTVTIALPGKEGIAVLARKNA